VTFDWLDKEKPAQRAWRGLPYNRALDSGDFRWFPNPIEGCGFWRNREPREADLSPLAVAMRNTFRMCVE
jgi:hypothetical protein